MPPRGGGRHPPARGAHEVSLLDEVGLDDLFDGPPLLAQGGGQALGPHRPAVELLEEEPEELPVHHVEAVRVHLEHVQRAGRHFRDDPAVGPHLGVVAHPAQEPVRDPGGAARAARELPGAPGVDRDPQDPGRAGDDLRQLLRAVELQAVHDAEAVAERRREEPRPGGGPDEGEGREVQLQGARGRALADHDVDLAVLHRRVEDLLDGRVQAMDLVEEEHVPPLEVGQEGGEVRAAFDDRARRLAEVRLHLVGDDVGEGGLAEARRAEDEDVVEGVPARPRGLDEEAELLAHRGLADVFVQPPGADAPFEQLLAALRLRGDDAVVHPGPARASALGPGRSGRRAPAFPASRTYRGKGSSPRLTTPPPAGPRARWLRCRAPPRRPPTPSAAPRSARSRGRPGRRRLRPAATPGPPPPVPRRRGDGP